MICRISTPSTSMKFSIKVACKFHINQKPLIERTNACTRLIIIRIRTTIRIWARFTRRREHGKYMLVCSRICVSVSGLRAHIRMRAHLRRARTPAPVLQILRGTREPFFSEHKSASDPIRNWKLKRREGNTAKPSGDPRNVADNNAEFFGCGNEQ